MKLINYIKKLINRKSNESSKRFVALTSLILVCYATIRFTTEQNVVLVIAEVLGFILVLFGVAVWENIKRK